MQMNALFAAGLFDNPWMVAILVVGGALVNWLSSRRQEKQAGQPPESDKPAPSAGKPADELTLEEALRRLMGGEPPSQGSAPPHGETPPVDWEEDERPTPAIPALSPPPITVAQTNVATVTDLEKEAARRFEQLNDHGRHPATVIDHGRGHRPRGIRRTASLWRDPRSARQAFVASIVFAPPKSLESRSESVG